MTEYGTGRIDFTSNDRSGAQRGYSERSIIQLVETNFPHAKLCALDVEHNKERIFDIPLENLDQYKFGNSIANPDEVRGNNGLYRLWLSAESRDRFHTALRTYFQLIEMMQPPDEDRTRPQLTINPGSDLEPSGASNDINHGKSNKLPRSALATVSPKDLLLDIDLLGRYIEQGDAAEAATKATKLAGQGVRIQNNLSKKTRNENKFTIQVQLDGTEYGVEQSGGLIPVTVFPSTTVRELRAAFDLAYQYPLVNQYMFVNGGLAHDTSTMRDLKVGPDSLFILFLLKHFTKTRF